MGCFCDTFAETSCEATRICPAWHSEVPRNFSKAGILILLLDVLLPYMPGSACLQMLPCFEGRPYSEFSAAAHSELQLVTIWTMQLQCKGT